MNDDINQVFGKLKEPDWEAWNRVKIARLWHAVALACNLAPDNFQLHGLSLVRLFLTPPRAFEDLLAMATGSIGAGGILKILSKSDEGLEESEVNLSNFAAWLSTVPHKPPAEFPWQPEKISLSNMNWPWGRHETPLLRKLAVAADKFWKNYDPSDTETAPKNAQVIAWLIEQNVSENIAKAMATILRDERLPTRTKKQ